MESRYDKDVSRKEAIKWILGYCITLYLIVVFLYFDYDDSFISTFIMAFGSALVLYAIGLVLPVIYVVICLGIKRQVHYGNVFWFFVTPSLVAFILTIGGGLRVN